MFFKKFLDNDFVILLLYVDDMLIVGRDTNKIEKLKIVSHDIHKILSKKIARKCLILGGHLVGMESRFVEKQILYYNSGQ